MDGLCDCANVTWSPELPSDRPSRLLVDESDNLGTVSVNDGRSLPNSPVAFDSMSTLNLSNAAALPSPLAAASPVLPGLGIAHTPRLLSEPVFRLSTDLRSSGLSAALGSNDNRRRAKLCKRPIFLGGSRTDR